MTHCPIHQIFKAPMFKVQKVIPNTTAMLQKHKKILRGRNKNIPWGKNPLAEKKVFEASCR